MYFLFAVTLLASQVNGPTMIEQDEVSNLKSDERIVLITTDAWLSHDGRTWTIPIHVWVHELESASRRRASIAKTLRLTHGLTISDATRANFDRRIRLIVADNERGKRIAVRIANKTYLMPATGPNGHAVANVRLDATEVSRHARDGQLICRAVLQTSDRRDFAGKVNLVPGRGVAVISDFDDTVKVSHVTERAKMLDQSLYQDFRAVDGMPDLYASWAKQGATFHFVSSSPWHLYEPIDEFLDDNGFPRRSLSLKHFRFKDTTLLNLFRSGLETKPDQIRPILTTYGQRRFVLVGDSGEHDPEVYAAMYKEFEGQIERIYIRNITNASRDDARFGKLFEDIPDSQWSLFTDPSELQLP